MGEMPGPYIKWFLLSIGPEGLCRLLDSFPTRAARALCTVVLIDRSQTVHLFQGITKGRICEHPRGENRFGWDPIFVPEDSEQGLSYAEMSCESKNLISHRSRALALLKAKLSK
jgi:non-canonical purine NTP pyrophosphatase (RdgB/HAM1 family)